MTGLSRKGSCKGFHGHSKSQAGNKSAVNLKTSSLTSSLNTDKCYLCDGSHLLFVCKKFLALSVADRIKKVRSKAMHKLPQKRPLRKGMQKEFLSRM